MVTRAEIKEKFANHEYPIHVIGRHVEITDPIKNYAVDKLKKVTRFGGRVVEATIIMDIQKAVHSVDFIINVNNTKIKVSGRSTNMYASIDEAIHHLEAKLSRYTRRLHMHHSKGVHEIEMNVNVLQSINPLDEINDQIDEENLKKIEEEFIPRPIVSREKRTLKTLTQEEAIMMMGLSGDFFMIYRAEDDNNLLKVIYRRNDGNYGVIEVE